MNERIKYIINNPLEIEASDLLLIEDESEKYPYFYPLALFKAKLSTPHIDDKLSEAVQKASVYASNRKILFDYLNFKKETVSNIEPDEKTDSLINQTEVQDTISIPATTVSITNEIEEIEQKSEKEKKEKTQINVFKSHSFNDWLKVAKNKSESKSTSSSKTEDEIDEKYKVIEAFLDKNPKIVPAKEYKPSLDLNQNQKDNLSHLMTETLAKIYVEQNKYDKAIKAYRILRLKYPEKSGYFADQINKIKELKNK